MDVPCVGWLHILQVQRASTATIQQLRQAADDAQAQLMDVQQVANKQVAHAQEAAAKEVELYRQRWRDEFERRRKLHNQVGIQDH